MGDAPATKATAAAAKVAVRVRATAHVDVADLDQGTATKAAPLVVSAADAKVLLERHPYLEATEG